MDCVVLVSKLALLISVAALAEKTFDPPIYKYDNYEICKAKYNQEATFCITKIHLDSEDGGNCSIPSAISPDNHPNILSWSVCVQDCKHELMSLTPRERVQLNYRHDETDESNQGDLKHRYGNLTKACLVNRLQYHFNKTGTIEVQYCESNEEQTSDWVAMLFLGICITSIVLTGYATLTNRTAESLNSTEPGLVEAFAIQRSWRTFLDIPTTKTYQDFRYIEGVRVVVCLIIVFMHTWYEVIMLPTSNPEKLLEISLFGKFINIMSPTYVQIFLTISGLLVAVYFLPEAGKEESFRWSFLRNKLLKRLIRLMPTYVLWMLFTASLYGTMNNGPMAYHTLKMHSQPCREFWWTNLIFTNNFPIRDSFCMIHTWYLGADMQVFVAALGFLTLMWRFPDAFPKMVAIVSLSAVSILVFISHAYALDPIFRLGLGDMLYGIPLFRWMLVLYIPGYTNIWSYLCGITAGHMYVTISNGGPDLRDTTLYKIIRFLSSSLVVAVIATSFVVYNSPYDRSSIWTALMNAVTRIYIPLFVSVCFVEGIARPAGSIRSLFNKPVFSYLGKLCYIVFIVHYSVIKVLYCRDDPNGTVDYATNIVRFGITTVVSFALAFLIFLFIEQPLVAFLRGKLVTQADKRKTQ